MSAIESSMSTRIPYPEPATPLPGDFEGPSLSREPGRYVVGLGARERKALSAAAEAIGRKESSVDVEARVRDAIADVTATSKRILSAGDGGVVASGPMTLDAEALLFEAALLRSCQIAGATEAMLALSVDHVIGRVQFGKPLARLQAVQQQLAVLAEECAAVACASASACQAATFGDARFEIAAAKWRANRAAVISVDIAHQVHGAIGFTREYPLHRFSLQALKWRGEQGSEQYWAHWMGRFTLAARPLPLWHWLTARSDRLLEAEREALK